MADEGNRTGRAVSPVSRTVVSGSELFCRNDLVFSFCLCLVERGVGAPEQRVRGFSFAQLGDADARSRANIAAVSDDEGRVGQKLLQPLRDRTRTFQRGLGEQYAELLAAETGRDIDVADVRAERVRERMQH